MNCKSCGKPLHEDSESPLVDYCIGCIKSGKVDIEVVKNAESIKRDIERAD